MKHLHHNPVVGSYDQIKENSGITEETHAHHLS